MSLHLAFQLCFVPSRAKDVFVQKVAYRLSRGSHEAPQNSWYSQKRHGKALLIIKRGGAGKTYHKERWAYDAALAS